MKHRFGPVFTLALCLATLLIAITLPPNLNLPNHSHRAVDVTHTEEEMDTASPETRYFEIDNRVSGSSSGAVVVTAECTLIALEQTNGTYNVTCGNFNASVTDILGADTIAFNCTDRVKNSADVMLKEGDDAIVQFGWPQGETPPRASLDTPNTVRQDFHEQRQ